MPTVSAASNGHIDEGGQDGEEVETQTYIWVADEGELEEGEWDFEVFRREKLHLWDGGKVEDSGMRAVDELNDRETGHANGVVDGTRGRGVVGGEFERAVRDDGA